jgi:hypothetical protein
VFLVLIAWSNEARFGTIFKTGYHLQFQSVSELFANPLLRGMRDLLLNGEVGLLVFVPWLLVLPFIWRFVWAHHRTEAILVLGVALTNYVFFAKYTAWRGGLSFGPRLLVPTIPFLVVPLAVLFDQKREIRKSAVWRATVALVACGFAIALATAPYPFSRYYSLRREAREQGRGQEFWVGRPLFKVPVDVPKLFLPPGNDPADVRDQRYLMSYENGVNLVKPDCWILKAALQGIPVALLLIVTIALLSAFAWGIRRAYLPDKVPV